MSPQAGKIARIIDLNNAQIVGAGGFGIVARLSRRNEIVKLLYDTDECKALQHEAKIQQQAYKILKEYPTGVSVPKVTYVSSSPISFQGSTYLCGIGMEYLKPPLDFTEQVHIVLGNTSDLDCEWGRKIGKPVSADNPTRGFFASPETATWIWEREGSDETIESVSYKMGKTFRTLLEHGIVPIDLEWVWSGGTLWIIDFGLCEFGTRDPLSFLTDNSKSGLGSDFYWPAAGCSGHNSFLTGFLGPPSRA